MHSEFRFESSVGPSHTPTPKLPLGAKQHNLNKNKNNIITQKNEQLLRYITKSLLPNPPPSPGEHTLEGGTGTCCPQDPPFSGHILAPETHLFKPFTSSGDPTWIF